MHILVVDDDIPTVAVIRTSLHWDLLGIDRVETAYDYTEAQNKICASQPDIILCDIEMPRGSGLDLLRWLREEKRDCEFVFLTCHANFDYAKTALQYGCLLYTSFIWENINHFIIKVQQPFGAGNANRCGRIGLA